MVTHVSSKFNLPVFWDDEFKSLDYIHEPFNDPDSLNTWERMGYGSKVTGAMCDMRSPQPSWNKKFIEIFNAMGWKDVGTSYYRMDTGTVMPTHSDLYVKYVNLFGLAGAEHRIHRAIVFLEDWKSGHYSEVNGVPIVGWQAGQCASWQYDTPHSAANLGEEDRYTLQITGWR
jgi:hypothetical protein